MMCARNTLNACSFKRKCEESDSFFRNQLLHNKVFKNKDIITISSGETSEEDNSSDEYQQNNYNNDNNQWNSNQSQSNDDDQLALIPEIELITPNDDEKVEEGQIQGYQCSICFQIFAFYLLV